MLLRTYSIRTNTNSYCLFLSKNVLEIFCYSLSIMTKDGKQKKFNNFTGPNPSELRIKFPSYKSPGAEFKQENDEQGRICFVMSGGTVEVCYFPFFKQ